jgi:hypothetical protein
MGNSQTTFPKNSLPINEDGKPYLNFKSMPKESSDVIGFMSGDIVISRQVLETSRMMELTVTSPIHKVKESIQQETFRNNGFFFFPPKCSISYQTSDVTKLKQTLQTSQTLQTLQTYRTGWQTCTFKVLTAGNKTRVLPRNLAQISMP